MNLKIIGQVRMWFCDNGLLNFRWNFYININFHAKPQRITPIVRSIHNLKLSIWEVTILDDSITATITNQIKWAMLIIAPYINWIKIGVSGVTTCVKILKKKRVVLGFCALEINPDWKAFTSDIWWLYLSKSSFYAEVFLCVSALIPK